MKVADAQPLQQIVDRPLAGQQRAAGEHDAPARAAALLADQVLLGTERRRRVAGAGPRRRPRGGDREPQLAGHAARRARLLDGHRTAPVGQIRAQVVDRQAHRRRQVGAGLHDPAGRLVLVRRQHRGASEHEYFQASPDLREEHDAPL